MEYTPSYTSLLTYFTPTITRTITTVITTSHNINTATLKGRGSYGYPPQSAPQAIAIKVLTVPVY